MKTEVIEEIIAILPQTRTKYAYFKDKYAADLLRWGLGTPRLVRELRQSAYAPLLERPVVRARLAQLGSGVTQAADWCDLWGSPVFNYLLTLGSWGRNGHGRRGYYQTTGGDANLVLQLNFSNEHNAAYRALIGDADGRPFEYLGHPIARWPYRTLAWARIDLSFETGEALIEEVQTDWIRYANGRRKRLLGRLKELGEGERRELRYLQEVVAPHAGLWPEAMLSAALWFLRTELGLTKVYYHTHDSGCRLKRIRGRKPPASLYDDLPRRFCFQLSGEAPRFLQPLLRRSAGELRFYRLDLGGGLPLKMSSESTGEWI